MRELRWAKQRYVEIDLGAFPTAEESKLLDLFRTYDAGSDKLRTMIVKQMINSQLSDLLMIAAGRIQLQGEASKSLPLLRASLLARAIEASDPHSDWREVVNGLPQTKNAIKDSGGDPDELFGEVEALFPGAPARLLAYYDQGSEQAGDPR